MGLIFSEGLDELRVEMDSIKLRYYTSIVLVFACWLGVLSFLVEPVLGEDTLPLGFENSSQWSRWNKVTFPGIGATDYRYYPDSGVVCGTAAHSASGYARRFPGTLSGWPVLSWEWRIDSIVEGGDAHRRSGDDYAARVYVNFKRGEDWGFWESTKATFYETVYGAELPGKSLNFIWANRLNRGNIVESPFTSRAQLIALESGSSRAGEWVRETVRIRDWYRKAFDGTPPPVQSVAIMTDADNTNGRARGCYRRIRLRTAGSGSSKSTE